jgi:hypothetical protein
LHAAFENEFSAVVELCDESDDMDLPQPSLPSWPWLCDLEIELDVGLLPDLDVDAAIPIPDAG